VGAVFFMETAMKVYNNPLPLIDLARLPKPKLEMAHQDVCLNDLLQCRSEHELDQLLRHKAEDFDYHSRISVAWSYWHYGKHAEIAAESDLPYLAALLSAAWDLQLKYFSTDDPSLREAAAAEVSEEYKRLSAAALQRGEYAVLTFDDSHTHALATAFVAKLREMVGVESFIRVAAANARERTFSVCHSHDCCDANEVMSAAWDACFGIPNNPEVSSHADLWNAGWSAAKPLMVEQSRRLLVSILGGIVEAAPGQRLVDEWDRLDDLRALDLAYARWCDVLLKESCAGLALPLMPVEVDGILLTDDGTPISGYVGRQRWNGWLIPYLPHAEVLRLKAFVPDLHYEPTSDTFCWSLDGFPESATGELVLGLDADGIPRLMAAYAVGRRSWCWCPAATVATPL
jgi:hypothetical protein